MIMMTLSVKMALKELLTKLRISLSLRSTNSMMVERRTVLLLGVMDTRERDQASDSLEVIDSWRNMEPMWRHSLLQEIHALRMGALKREGAEMYAASSFSWRLWSL